MKERDGWWLPNTDEYFAQFIVGPKGKSNGFQVDHLHAAFKYVRDWRLAIDVGAHVGFWTEEMATRFASVHAFEPAPDTYECLSKNMDGVKNVSIHNAGVGADAGTCRITTDEKRKHNTGSRFISLGGDIPVVALDDMEWSSPCGLLKVDVEGFEHSVLRGARRLILMDRPVISMETDKPFAQARYGVPDDAAEKMLLELGYRVVEHMRPDKVFAWP